MFDWSKESKNKYFKAAEEQLKKISLPETKTDLLQVDREKFTYRGVSTVIINLKPIPKRGNSILINVLKGQKNFVQTRIAPRNNYGNRAKDLYYHGQLEYKTGAES